MRGLFLRLSLVALVPLGAAQAHAATGSAPVGARPAAPVAVPGQMLVGFAPHTGHAAQQAIVHAAGGHILHSFGAIHTALVGFSGSRAHVGATMRGNRHVLFAEPNFVLHSDALPNDPSFTSQWGLRNTGQVINLSAGTAGDDIHAAGAWDVTTGSSAVKVAVVDSGVDITHPDLAANIWTNPGESCAGCAGNGTDDDNNGYADDVHGWSCVDSSGDVSDQNGHGTHVAGILGATGNNGLGISGVNWHVGILPVKFIGADGSGTTADAICAILYSINAGADVINASWGDTEYSQALYNAIDQADQHGVLLVAAAGNDWANNDTAPHYPASYDLPNIISVAATDAGDNRAWFSDYGAGSVDIGAPGQNIYSTWPGGRYQFEDGTSMATPFVAGAAALVKAADPGATAMGIKALLLRSSDPVASLAGKTTSGGRLDASAAVHCADNGEAWVDEPSPGFVATAGQPLPISVIGTDCADPAGTTVAATANGSPISLTPRGDGLYTGSYVPTATGPLGIQATATAGTTSTQTVLGTVPVPITPGGGPVTVSMPNPGQRAVLGFAGTPGERVSAALTGVTVSVASVSIVNPDGTTLVSGQMVGTSGGFIDTRTLAQAGYYTIVITPQSSYTGAMTVTLYDVPPDLNGTITTDGSPNSVSLGTPGQNAQLTFAGTAGQRISMQVGNGSFSMAYLSIVNPDGTNLVSSTIFGTTGTFIDTKTLPATGTYTVVVNPAAAYTGSAPLSLYMVPPDPALSVSPGGSAVGFAITTPGQNARATFSGTAGQRVSLALGPDTIKQASVSVLRPDGTSLGSSATILSGGGFVDTRTLSVTGTYTVLVDPFQGATGSASLTLYDVPPDPAAAITPGGAAVILAAGTPGQNATAQFTGAAGQRISLNLTSVTFSQLKLSILNPDGSTLVSPQLMLSPGGFVDVRTLPAAGTYTIVVDPQAAATGQARLTLYDVPSDPSPSIVIGGAGAAVATPVPGQNATVTFTAAAGQGFTVKLTASSYSLARLWLLNPDGSTLGPTRYFGTTSVSFGATAATAGTYTIVIDPQQAYTGGVTVAVTSP